MILTNKAKYATIAVIDMFEAGFKEPVSLSSIAHRQNISIAFLEQIFRALKKAEIVKSVRGSTGGYVFNREPQDIKISDVILAVGENVKMTRCSTKEGCIPSGNKCQTHHIWKGLERNIHDYLSKISIANFKEQSFV